MQPEDLLKYLEDKDQVDTLDLVTVFNEEHQKIIGTLKSIEAHGDLIKSEQTSQKSWELTDEGKFITDEGKNRRHR